MKNQTGDALAEILGKLFLWIVTIIVGFAVTYYGAFVLGKVWGWFFEPAGFEPLSIRLRIGVFLVLGLLTAGLTVVLAKEKETESEWTNSAIRLVALTVVYSLVWFSAFVWNALL